MVTGHRGVDIADRLVSGPASIVPNPDYARNEMLRSYQVGIQALLSGQIPVIGALLALGDQPHIPASVIRQIVDAAQAAPKAVVIPQP